MKKLFLLILMCCLGETCIMKAANTDISSIANVIYIEPFQVQPGVTNYELSIRMKNSADIRGFQFAIVLPEGIVPVIEDDVVLCELNEDRAPKNSLGKFYHDLNASPQNDGSYLVLCGAQQDKKFLEKDGEVAVLYVNIASDMAEGDYPVVLKNIKLSESDISKYYETEMLETTASVTGVSDTRTILDETSTAAPASATNANVLVKRTINANEWSTICLPFSMTEGQTKEAFGSGVQIADFNNYEFNDEVGTITVKFVPATAIEANHPYIIKVAEKVTEFTVDGVDIIPEDEPMVDFDTSRRKNQPRQMVGNYVAGTVLEWGTLFLSGNQFWYSTGKTTMKGFRAYFNFNDLLPDFEESYPSRSITMNFGGGETTGISEIGNSKSSNSKYYDLQGRRVEKPGKGLFVKGGKKIIIK